MAAMKCHACTKPIEGTYLRGTLVTDRPDSRLNGIEFIAHFDCVRLVIPDRGIALPETEPDLVTVSGEWGEWEAVCRDHGAVAVKEELDDAHLAAARHIANRHAA